jgi:hypothetical protein
MTNVWLSSGSGANPGGAVPPPPFENDREIAKIGNIFEMTANVNKTYGPNSPLKRSSPKYQRRIKQAGTASKICKHLSKN